MNGKGDKWRKGTNYNAYYSNYDAIFRKKEDNKTVLLKEDSPIVYVYNDGGEIYFYGEDRQTVIPWPDYLPEHIQNIEKFCEDNNLLLLP